MYEERLILPLDGEGVTSERFGDKAATLSTLAQSGIRVPHGYCLNLGSDGVSALGDPSFLKPVWEDFRSRGRDVIVRSSGSVEDSATALFPGRFLTRSRARSFADLVAAVAACLNSGSALAARDYAEARGLSLDEIRLSVIIQEQISAQFAGALFTLPPPPYEAFKSLLEFVEGAADGLLAGRLTGALYGMGPKDRSATFVHLAGVGYEARTVATILDQCSDIVTTVETVLESPQDIEWVWDGQQLYVVQSRPVSSIDAVPARGVVHFSGQEGASEVALSLPMVEEWGLKAAAEHYFQRRGLGARNAMIVLPDADVPHDLAARKTSPHGTVIRFSYRTNVGLPKRFVPFGEDVLGAFVDARSRSEWVGIVSDYVHVEHSFEAYIDGECLLVEHVPGTWETDSLLSPDMFLWVDGGFTLMRFKEARRAMFELPAGGASPERLIRAIPPIALDTAQTWGHRFVETLGQFRRDFSGALPVNIHFIGDMMDQWDFLNIRPTANLPVTPSNRIQRNDFKLNRFFPISSRRDISSWDGRARILITAAADRGSQGRIGSLAADLRAAGVGQVYCTFGVLSHPAIIFREFGIAVSPVYDQHDILSLDGVPGW